MKLTCSRPILLSAFQIVGSVVPTRTPKDVLKNIKLTVADGQATLLGTDQEVGIRYTLSEVDSDSVGEVLIPTQRVNAILREVQGDSVSIEVEDGSLWIRSGQSEFQLSVEDPAEFPNVPSFEDSDYYVLEGKALKTGIQRTIFATDVESTRYALGGVLMEVRDETLTLAATDGRRLAVCTAGAATQGGASEDGVQPIIPSKAMSLIERTIHDDDQEICVALHQNDILVRSGLSTIYARLVEGRFPNYRDVIPPETEVTVDLVAGPFLSAVRQAMIVTNEESHGVDFTFADGMVTLTSVGQDVGSSKIQVPIAYEGEELKITFDPKFVAEFLRVLDSASPVQLKLVDANTAAVFQADDSYTYVVMPLSQE